MKRSCFLCVWPCLPVRVPLLWCFFSDWAEVTGVLLILLMLGPEVDFLVWRKAESDTDRVGQEERKVRNEPEKRGEGCILHIPYSEVEGSWQFYVSIGTHKNDVVNPEGKRIPPVRIHQLFFLQESPWEGLQTMILGATTPPLSFLLTWTNLSVYSTFDTIPQASSASVWDNTYQNFCELEHWPGGWTG